MLASMWRKGSPSTPLVGMQIGKATMENNMEVPENTYYFSFFKLSL